jgi:predicted permease
MEILLNTFPIYLAIMLGAVFRRKGYGGDGAKETIAKLTFNIVGPFLAFKVMYGLRLDISNLLVMIGLASLLLLIYVSLQLLGKIFKWNVQTLGAATVSSLSFAVGSFAYPFIQANFDNSVFAEVVIIDIFLFLFFLTGGYFIAIKFGSQNENIFSIKDTLRKIFTSPLVVAIFVTLLINMLQIELPEEIINISTFFASSFGFLAAFLLGMSLSKPSKENIRDVGLVFLVRNFIALFIAFTITSILDLSEIQNMAVFLAVLTPFATMPVVYTNEQKLDSNLSAQLSIFSSTAYLILYPLLISLLK